MHCLIISWLINAAYHFVFSVEFMHYHRIIWQIENHILIINISLYIHLFLFLFFQSFFFHVFCCISLIYWTSLIACAIVFPRRNHMVGSSENHPITRKVVVILTKIVIYVQSNIFFSNPVIRLDSWAGK